MTIFTFHGPGGRGTGLDLVLTVAFSGEQHAAHCDCRTEAHSMRCNHSRVSLEKLRKTKDKINGQYITGKGVTGTPYIRS